MWAKFKIWIIATASIVAIAILGIIKLFFHFDSKKQGQQETEKAKKKVKEKIENVKGKKYAELETIADLTNPNDNDDAVSSWLRKDIEIED